MTTCIHCKKKVAKQLRKIGLAELEAAGALLRGKSGDVPLRVHELRKHCKRMRALLRMMKPCLGKSFAKQDRSCRDFARSLAQMRDAHVVVHAYDELMRANRGQVDRRRFAPVYRRLKLLRDEEVSAPEEAVFTDELSQRLEKHVRWADAWRFEKKGWSVMSEGLTDIYREGRHQFKQVKVEGDDDGFHEWRKSVKYLMYQLQWLQPMNSKEIGEMTRELKRLADLLGDDHDLSMLRQFIEVDSRSFGRETTVAALMELIKARQQLMREEALTLAHELYAEKAGAWEKRMHGYWKQWPELAG